MSTNAALGLTVAFLIAIGLAGCGSSGRSGLSTADAARLRAELSTARTAAARHEAPQAASSLVAFRRQVVQLTARHELTAAQAQALELGAQQAQARVALDVKPAPATSPAAPAASAPAAPAPAAPAPPGPAGKAKGHDDKHGPGKHGNGHGDGGD